MCSLQVQIMEWGTLNLVRYTYMGARTRSKLGAASMWLSCLVALKNLITHSQIKAWLLVSTCVYSINPWVNRVRSRAMVPDRTSWQVVGDRSAAQQSVAFVWAFAVRICPKARFLMARSKWQYEVTKIRNKGEQIKRHFNRTTPLKRSKYFYWRFGELKHFKDSIFLKNRHFLSKKGLINWYLLLIRS